MAGAARTEENEKKGGGDKGLLTLTEVSKRTGISMPTLQKYKKKFAGEIPSRGQGRTQRYYEEAVAVFERLRDQNVARRGRPRKQRPEGEEAPGKGPSRRKGGRKAKTTRKPAARRRAATTSVGTTAVTKSAEEQVIPQQPKPVSKGAGKKKATKKRAAKAPAQRKRQSAPQKKEEGVAQGQNLTLTDVSKRTGISYPTLLRYVKNHLDRIPHEGEGRKRRFPPEAINAVQEIYRESRGGGRAKRPGGRGKAPGRRAAAGAKGRQEASAGGADVARALQRLESRLASLEKELKKPIRVEIRRR